MNIVANAGAVCNRAAISHWAGREGLDAAVQPAKPQLVLPEARAIDVADPEPSNPVSFGNFVHVIIPMFVQW